jgi:hypothetical protein
VVSGLCVWGICWSRSVAEVSELARMCQRGLGRVQKYVIFITGVEV